jgi:hypothetical protein
VITKGADTMRCPNANELGELFPVAEALVEEPDAVDTGWAIGVDGV